jgi:hypothetical protein
MHVVPAERAQASLLGPATSSVEVLERRRIAAAQRRFAASHLLLLFAPAQRRPMRLENEKVHGHALI